MILVPSGYERLSLQEEGKAGRPRTLKYRVTGSRFIKFCRIVICVAILFGVHVSLGFGRQRKTVSFLPPPLGRSPLTVLISTADASISEIDYWIHGFLSRLGRPIDVQVVETDNLKVVDDSIIISLNDLTKWANITTQSGFHNVGLLRVGDEYGNDTSYKPYSYVFRPYWFDSIYHNEKDDTPVLWIPNGYSAGVGPRLSSTLLSYAQRPQLCYFEGSLRDNGQASSREKMRQALLKWDPTHERCNLHWTDGFMAGHPPLMYAAVLGRAKYALCPAGNNAETIRFYEALENNAIPIVVEEPWMGKVFGNDTGFPFIVLKTWDEVGARLDALAAEDPVIGQARQMASRRWWDEIQEKIARDATSLVDHSFETKYLHV